MKKSFIKIVFTVFCICLMQNFAYAESSVDYIRMGYSLSQRGQYAEAIDCYTNAIKSTNKNLDIIYILRAAARVELKDYKGAMNDFTESIRINPKNYYAFSSRGWLKANNQDYKGAIKDYTEAINLDNTKDYLYFERGKLRYLTKDYTGALIDCTNSINTSPNYGAYVLRGKIRLQMGDYDGAVKDYTVSIKLNSKVPALYYDRAVAYNHLKQYDKAIKDLDKVIKLEPENAEAYYARGLAKGMSKKNKEALADLEKAKDMFFEKNDTVNYQNAVRFLEKIKSKK